MKKHYLIRRAQILWKLRTFFAQEGFLELEPPCIVTSPGLEPQLDAMVVDAPFAHRDQKQRRWLHTSPEYALKRFLGATSVTEVNRVYALGSCFRDELPSSTHSPEFTMLEWYARDLSLEGLMDQCEALITHLAKDHLEDLGHLGIDQKFERLTVQEAFLRYAEIDLNHCGEVEALKVAARSVGIRETALHGSWDDLYFQIFMDLVEPQLGQHRPTFLSHFPASQAALARLCPQDPRWARRFELFIGGIELANAFDELSDPVEQRTRFESDLHIRQLRGAQQPPIDEVLLEHLSQLGDCVGIALGFDRLVMLLCGANHLDEVRLQSWSSP